MKRIFFLAVIAATVIALFALSAPAFAGFTCHQTGVGGFCSGGFGTKVTGGSGGSSGRDPAIRR